MMSHPIKINFVQSLQLYDFVQLNNVQASSHQKHYFDQRTQPRTFQVGDSVWLSIPTAGKLNLSGKESG